MFVYCLLRLFKAGVAVFWAVPSPSGNGQGAVDGGMSGGEGPDPATRLVRFALNRHLLVDDGDAEGWSEVLYGFGFGIWIHVGVARLDACKCFFDFRFQAYDGTRTGKCLLVGECVCECVLLCWYQQRQPAVCEY